jgi:hypothetical protein
LTEEGEKPTHLFTDVADGFAAGEFGWVGDWVFKSPTFVG